MNTGTRRTTRCHQRRQRRRPGQRAASATKPASACEQEGVYAIPRGDWLAHSADFEITVGTPEQRSISSQPTRSPRLPFKSFIIHAAHTIPAAELDLGFRSVTVRHTTLDPTLHFPYLPRISTPNRPLHHRRHDGRPPRPYPSHHPRRDDKHYTRDIPQQPTARELPRIHQRFRMSATRKL